MIGIVNLYYLERILYACIVIFSKKFHKKIISRLKKAQLRILTQQKEEKP